MFSKHALQEIKQIPIVAAQIIRKRCVTLFERDAGCWFL